MKTLSGSLLLLCLLVPVAWAAEGTHWNGAELSNWIGKYPTDTSSGKSLSILEEKQIKPYLRATLTETDRKLLNLYVVETPIREVDGFLIVNRCKPRNCPAEFGMVVIDLKSPRIWIGFFLRQEHRVSTRWYGNADDYSVLPATIRQEFLERLGVQAENR